MPIREKIERLAREVHDARGAVARFLLLEANALENMSMQEVAEATFTSKATLVRVAKALGFSGWTAFHKAYVFERKETERLFEGVDTNIPFSKQDRTAQMRSHLAQIYMESVYLTNDLCEDAALEKAASILDESERIVVLGIGANRSLSRIFIQKMVKLGKRVDLCEPADARYFVNTLTFRDCAILISYSGMPPQREPMALIPLCQARGVPMIALTGRHDNVLRQSADVVLTIFSKEDWFAKIASYSSEVSILFLLDLLYSAYFARHYDEHLSYRMENVRAMEQDKTF